MSQSKDVNFKVLIDRSPEIEGLRKIIQDKDELIKKYMAIDAERERKQVEYANNPKPAPLGNPQDTAPLESDRKLTTLHNFDWENSEGVLDMLTFPSVGDAIKTTQVLARKGSPDAKRALKQMERAALKTPLDMTFKGKITEAIKPELPISDFDDEHTRRAKQAHNKRIVENRTNWLSTRGE
jgi:hypothetical protein